MYREPDPLSEINKSLLVGNGIPSYGSVSDTAAPQGTPVEIMPNETDQDLPNGNQVNMSERVMSHRLITASSVSLPPVKWYRRFYIPGLINSRPSPFSNSIRTTKYTVLNFLFKNLWEQFHRWANIYFLFIALLNFVPAVQAVGKEVGFLPLLFVLSVTLVKDLFEDYRRFKSDREVNRRLCKVYDRASKTFIPKRWSSISVGDFVQLLSDDTIPADLLFLRTSDPGNICYIQTSNIDGETNLKQRQVAPSAFSSSEGGGGEFDPSQFTGDLYCEQPHNRIHEINGYIKTPDKGVIGVSRANFLLRGCVLRNTESVVGVVVYAGHETKAMLNNSGPRAKRTKLERTINAGIIFQMVVLIVICLLGAIVNGVWTAQFLNSDAPYFPFTSMDIHVALETFTRFWTFIILYQVIVPISLYVTIEIVKFIQIYFINWDREMYYAPLDTPLQCRALNISEDLGQIQYVFSDKTGTLTENQMVFKCCSVGGINYPHSLEDELNRIRMSAESTEMSEEIIEVDYPQSPVNQTKLDPKLSANLSNSTVRDFFTVMAICNTVVISSSSSRDLNLREKKQEKERIQELNKLKYEAESPDEAALVEAARAYGYTLTYRSPHECTMVTPEGVVIEYDILHMLEFDSNRKCMSVVVRQKETEEIILYSKGADSVIYKNLDTRQIISSFQESEIDDDPLPSRDDSSVRAVVSTEVVDGGGGGSGGIISTTAVMKDRTHCDLNDYAKLGLRTLCMAKRVLTESEYKDWLFKRHDAEVALSNRDGLLFQSALSIEQHLQLLGATGIEDKLQTGVPEAIASLRAAGINVWVLTGDKQETAINIGYSSKLISGENMDVIILNAYSQDECRSELVKILQTMGASAENLTESEDSRSELIDSLLTKLVQQIPAWKRKDCNGAQNKDGGSSRTLVIDGATLQHALNSSLRTMFIEAVSKCQSVICCRVTPLQKAQVVELVKNKMGKTVLAIGDGANDVNMIQKADVGIGIAGREGMQAVMASDFSMARFHFLVKLLLVHGHWSYGRLARLMLYFFYKNLAYAAVIFWFQIFSAFSGSNPIDSVNLFMYNLIFTSLPIIVVAITDKDLKADVLLREKRFYQQGRCSEVYTHTLFGLAVLDGFYQSAVCFFIAYGAYYLSDVGVSEFGFLINTSIVVVVSLHLAVETLHWTVVNHIVLWGSILITFLFNYIYCAVNIRQPMLDPYFVFQMASLRAEFWFVLILTPVVALLPRLLVKVFVQEINPSPVMAARVKWSRRRTKGREVSVSPYLDDTTQNNTTIKA